MASASKKLIVITGPTASGKTGVAIQLAPELQGAVVSADSRQVYAGMNVGTATPPPAFAKAAGRRSGYGGQEPHPVLEPDDIQDVSHYLFNIRRPTEPLSLSDWQAAASAVIEHIHATGGTPLLVGGTMLYVDSIIKNYDLPAVEPNLEFRHEKESEAVEVLYAQLITKDPRARDFIEPQNKRRIIRALEVMQATGRTFSELRRQRPSPYDITVIGLFDSWEALEKRIELRVKAMLTEGLIEETRALVELYGSDLPLLQTLNYKQALGVLQGTLSENEALEDMRRATIRYARRQMSWWKGRQEISWFSTPDIQAIKAVLD